MSVIFLQPQYIISNVAIARHLVRQQNISSNLPKPLSIHKRRSVIWNPTETTNTTPKAILPVCLNLICMGRSKKLMQSKIPFRGNPTRWVKTLSWSSLMPKDTSILIKPYTSNGIIPVWPPFLSIAIGSMWQTCRISNTLVFQMLTKSLRIQL